MTVPRFLTDRIIREALEEVRRRGETQAASRLRSLCDDAVEARQLARWRLSEWRI